MNFREYQEAAMRTSTHTIESTEANLVHAALGVSTEAGKFATSVKRIHRYRKELDLNMRANIVEELGDLMWYIALAASAIEVDLELIANGNILKLMSRFPDNYTNEAAEARADKGGLDARVS